MGSVTIVDRDRSDIADVSSPSKLSQPMTILLDLDDFFSFPDPVHFVVPPGAVYGLDPETPMEGIHYPAGEVLQLPGGGINLEVAAPLPDAKEPGSLGSDPDYDQLLRTLPRDDLETDLTISHGEAHPRAQPCGCAKFRARHQYDRTI
jgi:hypothetical protein